MTFFIERTSHPTQNFEDKEGNYIKIIEATPPCKDAVLYSTENFGVIKRRIWTVDIDSLKDLLDLTYEVGYEIIVSDIPEEIANEDEVYNQYYTLEIYDDYRE